MDGPFVYSFCRPDLWKRDLKFHFNHDPNLGNDCFNEVAILFPAHLAAILLILVRYWFLKDVSYQDQPAIKFTGGSITLQNSKIAASLLMSIIALIQLFSVISRETGPEGHGVAPLEVIMILLVTVMYAIGAFVMNEEKQCYVNAGGWTLRLAYILAGFAEILKFQSVIGHLHKADVNTFFIVYIIYASLGWALTLVQIFVFPTDYEVLRGTDYRALHNRIKKSELESPEKDADFLSLLTFSWLSSLLQDGYRKPLQSDDIYGLAKYDQSKTLTTTWNPVWKDHMKRPNPSLVKAISEVWGYRFWGGGMLKLINDGAQFIGPIFLSLLVDFVGDRDQPEWKGYFYAGLLFVCTMIGAVGEAQYFQIVMRVGAQVRSALQNSVFKKSMYISNKGRREGKFGANLAVNNLISSDCENIEMATRNFHILWSSPLRIFISIFLLYRELSWPSLVGAAFLVMMIPLQKQVVTRLTRYARAGFKRADKRVKKEKEAVEAMQIVKCYAWEQSFVNEAASLREAELSFLRKSAVLGAFNMCLIFSVPVLVSSISFAVYILAGNELTASKAFTSLALYNVLRMPLIFFPQVIAQLTVALASMDRLEDYLSRDEVEEKEVMPVQEGMAAVQISDGTFAWGSLDSKKNEGEDGKEKKGEGDKEMHDKAGLETDYFITLKDINMKAENGQLVAIIGATGAGKSSLLHAVLGEIPTNSGVVQTRGTIAYVPQQAWIYNATIRNNILFGMEYDEKRYCRAVRISGLSKDLQNLAAGDMTEIGERGINLSGGQKQRVSIARSVYADCDVYLLDDPFSALDAHVGKEVFEKCVHEGLREKTRILVTNQIQFIHKADHIIWLHKNPVDGSGFIHCQGTFHHLMTNHSDFRRMMEDQGQTDKEAGGEGAEADEHGDRMADEKHQDDNLLKPVALTRIHSSQSIRTEAKEKAKKQKVKTGSALIVKEAREEGTVSMQVIKDYVVACGGTCVMVNLLFLWVGTQALSQAANFWLTVWTEDMLGDGYSVEFYLSIYVAWTLAQSLGEYVSSYYFALRGIEGAQFLHDKMFKSLLMAPMRFYNETPLGRIINRLTKDQSDIDRNLSRMISLAARGVLQLVGTMVIIGVVQPLILIMFAPVLYLFWYAQRYFQCTAREVKRLDSVTRSPIYAQFNQCLDGTSSIRAYKAQSRLIDDFYSKVDNNVRMYLTIISSNRWLALRLELLGALIASTAAAVVVITRNSVQPGAAGLALSQAFAVTGTLNLVVRLTAEAENNLNSVERVSEYGKLESEASARIKDKDPSPSWPNTGKVRFENVQMRYRPGLPLVLRGLTFEVQPGQKVGIVGRTGAGKSSLFVALYRLVELNGGKIVIDGVNCAEIGLWTLREKLSIIPQDPVLFRGTIRFNMDPFDEHQDREIVEALKRAHLFGALQSIVRGINAKREEAEKRRQEELEVKMEQKEAAGEEVEVGDNQAGEGGRCCGLMGSRGQPSSINNAGYAPLTVNLPVGDKGGDNENKVMTVLDVEVEASGENFSVGQRQLLCLARALLRHSKILVLDEATAAVDTKTDELIQQTIRSEFKDCTMLTIAHRINTIIDADRVLVMDLGRVAEYDTPKNLLMNEDGAFTSLVNDTGPEVSKFLKDVAFGRIKPFLERKNDMEGDAVEVKRNDEY